ncbi:STAS domain-containing protein [Spirillospora sp. CA-128828]|uniref:STAS domain-containing protein n=1 Tax=Spirillospora sp. CA-128828 TaxID=3240033 RepID=UPI003D8A0849
MTTPDAAPAAPRLAMEMIQDGAWQTVQLRGELDRFTAPALLGPVVTLIAQEVPPLIALELSQVSFCDSVGLNSFVRLWKRAASAGGELLLLRPQQRLADSLTRTGIDRHVRVRDSLPA